MEWERPHRMTPWSLTFTFLLDPARCYGGILSTEGGTTSMRHWFEISGEDRESRPALPERRASWTAENRKIRSGFRRSLRFLLDLRILGRASLFYSSISANGPGSFSPPSHRCPVRPWSLVRSADLRRLISTAGRDSCVQGSVHVESEFVASRKIKMADVVARGWERYLGLLQEHPLRTKMITAGVLAGSSDLVSQKIAGAKSFDYRRAVLMMLYGLLYGGPFGHFWHKLMDRIFAGSKKDGTTIVKKVVVEQLTSNPWNNLFYMCYLGFLIEGRTWTSMKSKLRSDFPGVQLNSWRFWPIIGLVNYKYIPLNLRVLFANLAAVCWANFVKWRVLSSARVPVVNSGLLKKAL